MKKKRLFSAVCCALAGVFTFGMLSACGGSDKDSSGSTGGDSNPPSNGKEEAGDIQLKDFSGVLKLGIGEVLYAARGSGEPAATADYIATMSNVMGAEAQRVWVKGSEISHVNEQNQLEFDMEKVAIYQDYMDKLVDNGVEHILIMSDQFCAPYGHFGAGQINTVPDPETDYENYLIWLDLIEQFYTKCAEFFPEARYFEVGNELDYAAYEGDRVEGEWAKVGQWHDGRINYYSIDRIGKLSADALYEANKAVKSVNPKNVVLNPGTMGGTTRQMMGATLYFYSLYDAITLGQTESKDTDPMHYFQIFNIHPYPYYLTGDHEKILDDWQDEIDELYAVSKEFNHEVKCWFTEFGCPNDYDDDEAHFWSNEDVAIWLPKYLDRIKALDYVDVMIFFRLTDLWKNKWEERENNMGMFLSPNFTARPGYPKETAKVLYKYFTGKKPSTSDPEGLYWYYLANKS